MIRIQHIHKTYTLGNADIPALKDVNLEIKRGEFVGISGASGSGKSTLLNLVGCIETPSSGSVWIDDREVSRLSSNDLADLRASRMGYVFQTFNLLPIFTAYENVEFPLQLQKAPAAHRHEKVVSLLQEVGLEKFSAHRPAQLSGGQRQRVAIARALAGSPSIVLADEPTANLDHVTGLEIVKLLRNLNKKREVTLLLASHDPVVLAQADRVVELMDGQIVKDSQCT